ncbi:hypothetical protein VR46_41595, partial [Streptomyces sp. NRRL S-444]
MPRLSAGGGPAGAAGTTGPPRAAEAVRGRGRRREETAEFRAMWIASVENVDWPSESGLDAEGQRSELTGLLDTAVARRLNAVILQVRPTADAMWPAAREPWSQWLT